MKTLSIAIPSFNVEKYLQRCLDSLLYDESIHELLDVIIVNDGSVDNTLKIAKYYENKYSCVSVVDKKNGGHGSTVNAALRIAKGKYFKVIDSDDWVNIFDFPDFVKSLSEENADIIVTNYRRDILYDNSVDKFVFTNSDTAELNIDTIDNLKNKENFFFEFSMHSMAVKTESLKNVWGKGLLENTFYVDQQYVALSLLCAKTYRLKNYDIYRYFIGRPDQSMNPESFYKHRKDHERVLMWLLELYDSRELSNKEYLKNVLKKQVTLMLKTHYRIYNTKNHKKSINELKAFDRFLSKTYPDIKKPNIIMHFIKVNNGDEE